MPILQGAKITAQPRFKPSTDHWRQPCRGHIPQYLVRGTSVGISPQYYYVLSDIADQFFG